MKKFFMAILMLAVACTVFAEQRYVIEFKLKQTHMTLDLLEHAKDAMNAITFEIPVDKPFYDSVKEGDEIINSFRTGSLIISGSFGNWKMTVNRKIIR